MTIKLNRENEFQVNAKRILRLMRILHLKSVCRRRRRNYVKSTPEVTAEIGQHSYVNQHIHRGSIPPLLALLIDSGMYFSYQF